MVDLKRGSAVPAAILAAGSATDMHNDKGLVRLLSAADTASITQLAAWLKHNPRTFPTLVMQAILEETQPSPEAAREVLDAMVWRASASGETAMGLLSTCLDVMAERLTASLGANPDHTISNCDDVLVRSAAATLTSKRPARYSETAVSCLAEAGPGGALVLARAFDAVRGRLKLRVVRGLKPSDVLALNDNVAASLALSLTKLAGELEGAERAAVSRLLANLGSVEASEHPVIGTTETLELDDQVFHASWGAGTVIASDSESVTIRFGSSGTRTLLRALATLRRA